MLNYHFYTFDTNKVNFRKRLIAHFIDGLLLYCFVTGFTKLFTPHELSHNWFFILTYLIYSSWMEAYFGGTLGKLAIGLRVIMYNGDKVKIQTAFYRNFTKMLLTLTGMEILLLPLTKGFSGFHNRVAKTLIVNT